MRKLAPILVMGLLLVMLVGPAGAGAGNSVSSKKNWQYQYKKWMPAVWQRLAHCEGGTRPPAEPNWKHNSGTYQGAFGFYHGSWDQFNTYGYPSEAYLATPWQQYRVALAIHSRFGFTGWGCYNNSWVRYG